MTAEDTPFSRFSGWCCVHGAFQAALLRATACSLQFVQWHQHRVQKRGGILAYGATGKAAFYVLAASCHFLIASRCTNCNGNLRGRPLLPFSLYKVQRH
ncbi:hypothetical protein PaecuDRAFT_4578 [Paenibacillus curdlanolyticus YK9]|uniref:Uncharacterized protein n=1 Tax=Paenibacillus curdlanolyticus YK9 TaxID=717606 RepID=E0IFY7_9BACL|nr:hypothetical protein PaecuDRAFT_4578 [Paenibacillus curdlanolyticus YK9]